MSAGSSQIPMQAVVSPQSGMNTKQQSVRLALFDSEGIAIDLNDLGGGVDAAALRNIDCVIRYSDVQPERADFTTDLLRRVRWVSSVEPAIGFPYAVDGLDVWENIAVASGPPTGDITRSTPIAPVHAYWNATPLNLAEVTVPAGAAIAITSVDNSDGAGASATSIPIISNTGTARTWTRLASGASAVSRAWVDYWFNDTGSPVALDVIVTWGPDTPASNFACGVAVQLLDGVEDPATTPPTAVVVNTGADVAAAITSADGDQVLLAFVIVGGDALGTDYLAGTSEDTSPASEEAFTGEITYGWVFRTVPEAAAGSHTVGMNTPNPTFPLNIAVTFPALVV